jgi:hypothetical protein
MKATFLMLPLKNSPFWLKKSLWENNGHWGKPKLESSTVGLNAVEVAADASSGIVLHVLFLLHHQCLRQH